MAIVKGIEPGDVLWKSISSRRQAKRDPEQPWRSLRDDKGNVIYETVPVYELYKLENRRARTNGITVGKDLYPFFNKIKIRLTEYQYPTSPNNPSYTAVGVMKYHVSKDVYDEAQVCEVADKYYNRISNPDLLSLMIKDKLQRDIALLQLVKIPVTAAEEEGEDWPQEPDFPIRWIDPMEQTQTNRFAAQVW